MKKLSTLIALIFMIGSVVPPGFASASPLSAPTEDDKYEQNISVEEYREKYKEEAMVRDSRGKTLESFLGGSGITLTAPTAEEEEKTGKKYTKSGIQLKRPQLANRPYQLTNGGDDDADQPRLTNEKPKVSIDAVTDVDLPKLTDRKPKLTNAGDSDTENPGIYTTDNFKNIRKSDAKPALTNGGDDDENVLRLTSHPVIKRGGSADDADRPRLTSHPVIKRGGDDDENVLRLTSHPVIKRGGNEDETNDEKPRLTNKVPKLTNPGHIEEWDQKPRLTNEVPKLTHPGRSDEKPRLTNAVPKLTNAAEAEEPAISATKVFPSIKVSDAKPIAEWSLIQRAYYINGKAASRMTEDAADTFEQITGEYQKCVNNHGAAKCHANNQAVSRNPILSGQVFPNDDTASHNSEIVLGKASIVFRHTGRQSLEGAFLRADNLKELYQLMEKLHASTGKKYKLMLVKKNVNRADSAGNVIAGDWVAIAAVQELEPVIDPPAPVNGTEMDVSELIPADFPLTRLNSSVKAYHEFQACVNQASAKECYHKLGEDAIEKIKNEDGKTMIVYANGNASTHEGEAVITTNKRKLVQELTKLVAQGHKVVGYTVREMALNSDGKAIKAFIAITALINDNRLPPVTKPGGELPEADLDIPETSIEGAQKPGGDLPKISLQNAFTLSGKKFRRVPKKARGFLKDHMFDEFQSCVNDNKLQDCHEKMGEDAIEKIVVTGLNNRALNKKVSISYANGVTTEGPGRLVKAKTQKGLIAAIMKLAREGHKVVGFTMKRRSDENGKIRPLYIAITRIINDGRVAPIQPAEDATLTEARADDVDLSHFSKYRTAVKRFKKKKKTYTKAGIKLKRPRTSDDDEG